MDAAVANGVRQARKRLGLSQAALATQVGVSRQRVNMIEQGGTPSLSTAMRLARRLGTGVEELFAGHAEAEEGEEP